MFKKITLMVFMIMYISTNSDCNMYQPVCGSNNVTYQNSCRCQQAQVQVAYTGTCEQNGGLRDYIMRDSSNYKPNDLFWKYQLAAQEVIPKGPIMVPDAGVMKVVNEVDSGEWNWENGLHKAMNNMNFETKPVLDVFNWDTIRTDNWTPVFENQSVMDTLGKSDVKQNWDFVRDEEWAKKMEWTQDSNGMGFGTLTFEDIKPLEGVVETQSWDLSSNGNGDVMMSDVDTNDNVGVTFVGEQGP